MPDTGARLAHEERERELEPAAWRIEPRNQRFDEPAQHCATPIGSAPGTARSSSSATSRDMCVPLRSAGSWTNTLQSAIVDWTPSRSAIGSG